MYLLIYFHFIQKTEKQTDLLSERSLAKCLQQPRPGQAEVGSSELKLGLPGKRQRPLYWCHQLLPFWCIFQEAAIGSGRAGIQTRHLSTDVGSFTPVPETCPALYHTQHHLCIEQCIRLPSQKLKHCGLGCSAQKLFHLMQLLVLTLKDRGGRRYSVATSSVQ